MSKLTDFYSGVGPDSEGRMLEEILQWGDDRLEFAHDYIQWLFPLREPSNFNPDAPILTDEDIALWKANPVLSENMLRAFRVWLGFLGLEVEENEVTTVMSETCAIIGTRYTVQPAEWFNDHKVIWRYPNHNWLRITRVLRSMKSIGTWNLIAAADAFFKCLEQLHKEEGFVSEDSFMYWQEAWSITTKSQP